MKKLGRCSSAGGGAVLALVLAGLACLVVAGCQPEHESPEYITITLAPVPDTAIVVTTSESAGSIYHRMPGYHNGNQCWQIKESISFYYTTHLDAKTPEGNPKFIPCAYCKPDETLEIFIKKEDDKE
jgi:hypothetical protein